MADSGRGRRQGQPCLQACQGPLGAAAAAAVWMRTEAAAADQEIRPCDTALRNSNKDAIKWLKNKQRLALAADHD